MSQQKVVVGFASLIQFVNMMDFMMVMPLGPDISRALPILNSDIGTICGCYTLAIAVSGFILAAFLDRFDRKLVAMVAVIGLSLATLSTTFCTGLYGLIATRILAGVFGGPAAAIALTMATEAVPCEHRGKAVAAVMGAFSVSSVVAVPFGLELARMRDWKSPLYAISVLGIAVSLGIFLYTPSMKGHLSTVKQLQTSRPVEALRSMLCGKRKRIALLMMGSSMFSSFLIIPGISAFFQYNRGFPREDLGLLYIVGGFASLIMIQLGGWLSDRIGPLPINLAGTVLLVIFTADGFMHKNVSPLIVVFSMFMGMACLRNVSATSEAAKIPHKHERAAFMSLLSAMQHVGNGLGAVVSSIILTSTGDGALVGMEILGGLSIVAATLQPYLLMRLYRKRPKMKEVFS